MKTVCVRFLLGCPRSMVDNELVKAYFVQNGWVITDDFYTADVIVIAVCGVTEDTAFRSMRFISMVHKKIKKDALLIVTGCLSGMHERRMITGKNIIAIPPKNLKDFDGIINATTKITQMKDSNIVTGTHQYRNYFNVFERVFSCCKPSIGLIFNALNRAWNSKESIPFEQLFNIRIARGCMDNCSYCAIKFAHGSLVSKPIATLIDEFKTGLDKGYMAFALVGADVGAYGQDLNSNIVELLKEIFSIERDYKIHILDFNPRWLIKYCDQLVELLHNNNDKVDSILIPIESGSSHILQQMERGYVKDEVEHSLIKLKKALPKTKFFTHIIIGFPGETETDFDQTIEILQTIKFDKISIYKYSDREGTEAAQLSNKVSELQKIKRLYRLRKIISDSPRKSGHAATLV